MTWKVLSRSAKNGVEIMFIDLKPILEEGFFINMILASRNSGKTYSASHIIYDTAINSIDTSGMCKEQFIYLRRREKGELDKAKKTLFGKIENCKIANKGDFYFARRFDEEDEKEKYDILCGCAMSLNSASTRGFELPNLRYVFFDEFTVNGKSKYVNDEFNIFANFLETVVRLSEKVQVIMVGNSGNIYNPYTIGWNIPVSTKSNRWSDRERSITLRIFDSNKFGTERNESKIAKLFKGTSYDSWAGKNEFIENTYLNVERRSGNVKDICTLQYADDVFMISIDQRQRKMYISFAKPMKNHFAFDRQNISENCYYFGKTNPIMKLFVQLYTTGRVFYESEKVRTLFSPLLQFIISAP